VNNSATYGGALEADFDDLYISTSVFANNTANGDGFGGGMYSYHCDAIIFASVFYANVASKSGGGHYSKNCVSITVIECTFIENTVPSRFACNIIVFQRTLDLTSLFALAPFFFHKTLCVCVQQKRGRAIYYSWS